MAWVDCFSMFSFAQASVVSWVLVLHCTYMTMDMKIWIFFLSLSTKIVPLVLHLQYASKKYLFL